MTYNPDIHHRHSIRLREYDYSSDGAYFVTICTWQRECLFGDIVDGEMRLNDMGNIILTEWQNTRIMRNNVELDTFVIMPNHFHAIFFIQNGATVGAHRRAPGLSAELGACNAPLRRQSGSIGSILAGFKSATTKQINIIRNNPGCPVWQRNYYERVIRNDDELSRARDYIVGNPLKWALDKENPTNSQ